MLLPVLSSRVYQEDWIQFTPFFTKKTIFLTSCLLSFHQVSSEKGSTLKGKNLVPPGSKFFPFRIDPFSEGNKNDFDRVAFPLYVTYNCQNVMEGPSKAGIINWLIDKFHKNDYHYRFANNQSLISVFVTLPYIHLVFRHLTILYLKFEQVQSTTHCCV